MLTYILVFIVGVAVGMVIHVWTFSRWMMYKAYERGYFQACEDRVIYDDRTTVPEIPNIPDTDTN